MVVVHVLRDIHRERRHRIGLRRRVLLPSDTASTCEPAHQARSHHLTTVPSEVPKVSPERVGVLHLVDSLHCVPLSLRHWCASANEGQACICGAGEAGCHNREGGLLVFLQVCGVPGHRREAEDGSALLVRREEHDGPRGKALKAWPRRDCRHHTAHGRVNERPRLLCEAQAWRVLLVLSECQNLWVHVFLGDCAALGHPMTTTLGVAHHQTAGGRGERAVAQTRRVEGKTRGRQREGPDQAERQRERSALHPQGRDHCKHARGWNWGRRLTCCC
mmetsp:Transcript_40774/g.105154  ORF Transcript_40774/g.105154 Transcript_40774/m.105154 type:complete len:275 (+) Transcript_40774:502-1326(+)